MASSLQLSPGERADDQRWIHEFGRRFKPSSATTNGIRFAGGSPNGDCL